eukprot:m.6399 g.6399  ORF g.6399 m.6399 type:complete len:118 (-) comp3528_c0_seq1:563-916(-)
MAQNTLETSISFIQKQAQPPEQTSARGISSSLRVSLCMTTKYTTTRTEVDIRDAIITGAGLMDGSSSARIILISGNGKVSTLAKLRDPLVENSIANEENFQDFNSPEGMSGSAIIIS